MSDSNKPRQEKPDIPPPPPPQPDPNLTAYLDRVKDADTSRKRETRSKPKT